MKARHTTTYEGKGIVIIEHDSPLNYGHASYLLESADLAWTIARAINENPNDLRSLREICEFAYMMQQIDYAVAEALDPTDPYDEEEDNDDTR